MALALSSSGVLAQAAGPVGHDFNNDGSDDYPVTITGFDPTEPITGAARMWSGASKMVIDTIIAPGSNTLFGWSVGSAGDIDGDGFDDLIVGEPLSSLGGHLTGRVSVFSGDDSALLLAVDGPYLETGLGRYVAGVGDWNGDGVPDLAASGWDIADTDSDGVGDDPIGIVFVLSGADGAVLAEITDPTATRGFGYSVFGLGDVTGDGRADIAVVDRQREAIPGGGIRGQLFVFAGSAVPGARFIPDAHRTISNTSPGLRGFAAQVDTMHPALWLGEPTVQVISLTSNVVGGVGGVGGPNQAETAVEIFDLTGLKVGDKGLRSSLVLAGDTNLDGVVNALDVQDAMNQLGTSPGQTGVMPVADQNGDGVVDLLDVALVLDGYGGTTDIYQGLWAPGRLMATVGGSAGFGSLPGGGVIGGSGLVGPGRRPNEDCLRDMPMDGAGGPGILPWLLRADARVNCLECPECDEPDPRNCYLCNEAGEIVGGEITATPEQPKPGDTVTFSWTHFTVEGRTRKCEAGCGGGGGSDSTCPIDLGILGDDWVIELEDPPGAWTVVRSRAAGHSPTYTTLEQCVSIRFRLTSVSVGEHENCDELDPKEKTKEVQFVEEFEYQIECYADGSERNRVGIRELVNIKLNPIGTTGSWDKISGGGSLTTHDGGQRAVFRAPNIGDSTTIEIESGGCTRRVTFSIVEPSGIKITRWTTNFHDATEASAGLTLSMQVEPTDVSFRYIWIHEGTATGTASGGLASFNGWVHPPWTTDVGCNNFVKKIDGAYSGSLPPTGVPPAPLYARGTFSIDIPWYWRMTAGGVNSYRKFESFTVTSLLTPNGTMTHTKGGLSITFPFGPPAVGLPWTGATSPFYQEPALDITPCP